MPDLCDVVKDIINESTTKEYYEKRGAVQMDYILVDKNIIWQECF